MADNQFKVILGADSSPLKAALNDAFKTVQDFSIRVNKLPQVAFSTQGIDSYKRSVAQLKAEVNQLSLQNLNKELLQVNATVSKANLEGVKIRFGADSTELQKALKDATAGIRALNGQHVRIDADTRPLSETLKEASKDVRDFGISIRKIPQVAFSTQGIDNYRKSVNQLKGDIGKLNFQNFARQITGVNTAAAQTGRTLHGIKPGANQAGAAMTDLSRIVQDAPFGFIAIQNNINPLIESFGRLKASTGSGVQAFKLLAGSLMGPGGIGLAIAAASSALLIFQNGIGGMGKKAKEAKEETDKYRDSIRSIADGIAEEASRVSVLVAALQSDTLSRKQKISAIEELKKVSPLYFSQLREEEGLIIGLNAAYKGYLASLKKKFEAKVLENQLDQLFKQKFELEVSLDPKTAIRQNKEIADRILKQETDLRRKIQELGGPIDVTQLTDLSKITDKQREIISLQTQLSKLSDTPINVFDLTDSTNRIRQIDGQINTLLEKLGKMSQITIGEGGGGKELKKEDEVLKSLNKERDLLIAKLSDTDDRRKAGLITLAEERQALQDQLKLLQTLNAIDQREVQLGLKLKADIDPQLFQQQIREAYENYAAGLRGVFVEPVVVNPNIRVGNFDYFEKLSEAIRRQAEAKKLGVDLPLSINIEGESNVTQVFDKIKKDLGGINFEDAFAPMLANFRSSADNAKEQLETGMVTIFTEAEIESGVTNALSTLGADLGAAISSGENPFAAAAKSFLNLIGSVVQQFGERIIAIATAMLITKEAIEKAITQPAVALAAGVALVVLGAALKNVKFNVPGAAEGGILTGPRSGYLALLHGTEMVTPYDKIGKMMGGQRETMVTHKITGSELHLIYQTYLKERGRM